MAVGLGTTVSGDVAREMQETPARAPEGVRGTSGHGLSLGKPAEVHEHNAKLRDGGFIRDFRKMLRSHASGMAFALPRSLMQSAKWTVEVRKDASDEPADFLRVNFGLDEAEGAGHLDAPFSEYIGEMLTYKGCGFAVFEEEYEHRDGFDYLTGWRAREQDTLFEWVYDDRERLAGVRQRAGIWAAGTGTRTVYANQMLHLVQTGSASNPEGIGDLRRIWAAWRDCEKVYNLMVVGAQRYAVPTPKVRIDMEVAEKFGALQGKDRLKFYRAEMAAAKQWARRYCAGAESFIVVPDWWVIETFGANQLSVYELVRQIEHYERIQLTAGFAQFLQLGSAGSGGTFNLGAVHADIAVQAASGGLAGIRDRINGMAHPGRGTVGRLMKFNFPSLKPREYPYLQFNGIEADPFMERIADVPALIAAGALTPDDAIEQRLRDRMKLPSAEAGRSTFDRLRVNPLSTLAGQQARDTRAPQGQVVDRSARAPATQPQENAA